MRPSAYTIKTKCVTILQDLEIIFSNILDIYEFTANLLSSVEEQVEVAAESETLTVGICFLDMAEVKWKHSISFITVSLVYECVCVAFRDWKGCNTAVIHATKYTWNWNIHVCMDNFNIVTWYVYLLCVCVCVWQFLCLILTCNVHQSNFISELLIWQIWFRTVAWSVCRAYVWMKQTLFFIY